MEDALKSRFLGEIPLSSLDLESYVFVRGTSFEFDYAIVWTLSGLQIVLRSFLLVKEFRIENIEFIPLYSFGRRIIFSIMLGIIFVPLNCNSATTNILRFFIPKTSLSLTGYPVIKLFLIFFKSFILLKLNDFLCYKVYGYC